MLIKLSDTLAMNEESDVISEESESNQSEMGDSMLDQFHEMYSTGTESTDESDEDEDMPSDIESDNDSEFEAMENRELVAMYKKRAIQYRNLAIEYKNAMESGCNTINPKEEDIPSDIESDYDSYFDAMENEHLVKMYKNLASSYKEKFLCILCKNIGPVE